LGLVVCGGFQHGLFFLWDYGRSLRLKTKRDIWSQICFTLDSALRNIHEGQQSISY
jgi:hypothetical protein